MQNSQKKGNLRKSNEFEMKKKRKTLNYVSGNLITTGKLYNCDKNDHVIVQYLGKEKPKIIN